MQAMPSELEMAMETGKSPFVPAGEPSRVSLVGSSQEILNADTEFEPALTARSNWP